MIPANMIINDLDRLLLNRLIEYKSFTNNNSEMLKSKYIKIVKLKYFRPTPCNIFENIAMMVQKSIIVTMLYIGLKLSMLSSKINCSIIIEIKLYETKKYNNLSKIE